MSYLVIIPARYASTRLPGKPLLDIAGKAMLERVWERAQAAGGERVVIATDDGRVEKAARDFGADVLVTDPAHPSGTDRLAEVVEHLGLPDDAIVVNVQGDEPLIPPAVIDQVADNLSRNPAASIATLCEKLVDVRQLRDPNVVKVTARRDGMALYFSRACIPWPRDYGWSGEAAPAGEWYRHIGLYAYRAGFLRRYATWSPAPQERLEALEQLRALYEGEAIHVAEACAAVPGGVDTQADLEAVRALLGEP